MTSEEILFDAEERMEKAIDVFRNELRGLRTGRATPALYRNGYLRLPAESALVLAPGPAAAAEPRGRRK